ncbi:MAG: hypothetical protein JNG90_13030 [Planctomycetaceae bacterium]|nr:hypothetical protein [Planctomycetaceae bacterium]
MNHPNADRVRQLVIESLPDYGVADSELVAETLLLRDGYYCGRSFIFDSIRAVWLAEAGQVKFFADDGRWLGTLELEENAPRRKAA